MLPTQIVHILNFFDVCGYRTESSSLSKYRRIQILIFIIQFSWAVFLTVHELNIFVQFYPILGLLRTINELVQYSAGLFTFWLIIFDSFSKRHKHRCFWKIIERYSYTQVSFYRVYLCKLIESFLATIISYFSVSLSNTYPNISVASFFVLATICQLRTFYYMFCLEVVNSQLKAIEKEIIIMKSRFNGLHSERFKWVNEYLGRVNQMTELLNDIFGWSQVSSILFWFYSFLTDLNWLYGSFDLLSITQISSKLLFQNMHTE